MAIRSAVIPPAVSAGTLAAARFVVAHKGQDANAAQLANDAAQAGFRDVGAGKWTHKDGSFLAIRTRATQAQAGFQNAVLRSVADLTALPVLKSLPAVAAAQMPTRDSPRLKQQLTAAGFTEIRPKFFAHPDGSWVALVDKQVVRGKGASQLPASASVPTSSAPPQFRIADPLEVLQFQARSPVFADGFLACAQVGFLNTNQPAQTTAILASFGFKERPAGVFIHKDGSWIVKAGIRFERGHLKTRFGGVPLSPARIGAVNVPAQGFTRAVANAKLQKLTLDDVLKSDAALKSAGFKKTAPNMYTHKDGSFFAFTPQQTWTGENAMLFSAMPQPLSTVPKSKPLPSDAYLAVARTGGLKVGSRALTSQLEKLGFFAEVPGKVFSHDDGSFVIVHNDALLRGVNDRYLSSVPKAPRVGSIKPDHSRPDISGRSWSWFQANTALASVPRMSSASEAPAECGSRGFVLIGQTWWHKDGSWVDTSGGRIAVGWKGYRLGQLPYNNRFSA